MDLVVHKHEGGYFSLSLSLSLKRLSDNGKGKAVRPRVRKSERGKTMQSTSRLEVAQQRPERKWSYRGCLGVAVIWSIVEDVEAPDRAWA